MVCDYATWLQKFEKLTSGLQKLTLDFATSTPAVGFDETVRSHMAAEAASPMPQSEPASAGMGLGGLLGGLSICIGLLSG